MKIDKRQFIEREPETGPFLVLLSVLYSKIMRFERDPREVTRQKFCEFGYNKDYFTGQRGVKNIPGIAGISFFARRR